LAERDIDSRQFADNSDFYFYHDSDSTCSGTLVQSPNLSKERKKERKKEKKKE
jgi:hypothetical protein